jgi:shikimate dehydrogenase
MPHKAAVAALVDEASDDVIALGAVNCVVPVAGGVRLRGESTDGGGFLDALTATGVDVAGQSCVVLGAGGAARAVVLALARAGASDVAVVNRTPARAEAAAALAGRVGRVVGEEAAAGAGVVVNATSVGMGADGGVPLDPERLGSGQTVVDLVYDPLATPLLQAARARGAVTVDGLGMLVHQAARAFTLWTGEAAPVAAMEEAARSTSS